MNAKYALALILTLQVSMSLGDIPAPSKELVDKTEEVANRFYNRLINIVNKVHTNIGPVVEKLVQSEHGKSAKDAIDTVQQKPEFKAFVKLASGLGQEAAPLAQKVRTSLLGLYENYLRPQVGPYLNDALEAIRGPLDRLAPAQ